MSQTFTDDCFSTSGVWNTQLGQMEQNFAALKSNFSGTGAPSNAVEGMWWADTDDNILKIYSGAAWVNVYNWGTGQFYIGSGLVSATMISDAARKPSLVTGQTITPTTVTATNGNFTNFSVPGYSLLPNYSPGYWKLAESGETLVTSESMYKIFECYIPRSGTVLTRVSVRRGTDTTYGRIYKNGVAAGTLRASSGDFQNFDENIAVTAGDRLQGYVCTIPYFTAGAAAFQVAVNNPSEISMKYGFITYTGGF